MGSLEVTHRWLVSAAHLVHDAHDGLVYPLQKS